MDFKPGKELTPDEREELRNELVGEWEDKRTFVDQLRDECDYLYKKIDDHPFFTELEEGKLPIEKFRIYGIQNEFYIASVRAALAQGLSRASEESIRDEIIWFLGELPLDLLDFSFGQIVLETGVSEEKLRAAHDDPTVPLPNSRAYADFMFKEFSTKPLGVAYASFISCPWTYGPREIGGLSCARRFSRALQKHYGVSKEVVDQYVCDYEAIGEWHDQVLRVFKDRINNDAERLGERTKNEIKENFKRGTEYELMFWDAPHRIDPEKEREIGSYY